MSNLFLRILKNLYFCFQCLITVTNFALFYFLAISTLLFYGLTGDYRHTNQDTGLYILISAMLLVAMQVFVIFSGLSTWAMLKILLKKEITKFQKKLTIIFPILSTILYIAIALVIHFAKN